MGYHSEVKGSVLFSDPIGYPIGRLPGADLWQSEDRDPFRYGILQWMRTYNGHGVVVGFSAGEKVGGWKRGDELRGWLVALYRWLRENHPDLGIEGYIERRGEDQEDIEVFNFNDEGLSFTEAIVSWTEPRILVAGRDPGES